MRSRLRVALVVVCCAQLLAMGCSDDGTTTTGDQGVADQAVVTGDARTDGQPAGSCTDAVKNGDETDVDCGGGCSSKCAETKSCKVNGDCASGSCDPASLKCVAAGSCTDTVKNGDETDVDCGGSCPDKCADTKGCKVDGDCVSSVCDAAAKTCSAPSCTDTAKNGDETDVNCGGSCSTKCADTKGCKIDGDCASGACDATSKTCVAPSCTDTVKNGDETDVNCGGSCPKCADTKACKVNGDCVSGVCDGTALTCTAPSCTDTVKNGDETDVNCGGSCPKCADTKACEVDGDCVSGFCDPSAKVCAAPSCTDTVKNGDETDVNCGGSCPKCADTKACKVDGDCVSGVCDGAALTCSAPSCTDTVKNGDETDVNCGGSCPKCGDTKACKIDADCASGTCDPTALTCTPATSCTDLVKNGDETDVDCGGSCPKCADTKVCKLDADCASGICDPTALTCTAASCTDKVKNGTETDVDCGGSCPGCGNDQVCATTTDCGVGLFCSSKKCLATSCAALAPFMSTFTDGEYTIDPDGEGPVAPLEVHCDMSSDGGVGYTMVRFNDINLGTTQAAYREKCASVGMEVIVPRTKAHAAAIKVWNNGQVANLVNVFPKTNSAPHGLENWTGRCKGAACSFYLSDTRNANCSGTEPNGDNNTASAIYNYPNTSGNCSWGQWNDANDRVDVTGWVICSTNDAGPITRPTCNDYLTPKSVWNVGPEGISGPYPIQNGSTTIQVYCDQVNNGGGWTLGFLKNSAHNGSYGNFGQHDTNLAALAQSPANAANSATAYYGWFNLNLFPYSVFRIAGYNSSGLFRITNEIQKSSLRIEFGQNGYYLYNDPNGYYWCGGYASYTDSGVGQVNKPAGAPDDCKGHGSLGSGWDFSSAGGVGQYNQGFTMCGADAGSRWMHNAYGGSYVIYPATGSAYAIWVR